MARKKIRSYENEDIVVHYDVGRCIHAEECIHGLPNVFDAKNRPWIQPEHAGAEQIAAVLLRCPTGALKFTRRDGGPPEPIPETNTLTVAPNGPVFVSGDVQITAADGTVIQRETRAALCRCGASANKPFCDNSHLESDFQADGNVADNQKDSDDVAATGTLNAIPYPDGPLGLKGNFEISSADGTAVFRGTETALCRCGGSQNKPFCDGSHIVIGFTTE